MIKCNSHEPTWCNDSDHAVVGTYLEAQPKQLLVETIMDIGF